MDRIEYAPDTFRSRLLEILVGGDERAKARAYQELNDYYVANRDQSRMIQKQRETIDELRKSLQGSKAEIQAKKGNIVTLERKLGWADGRVSKLDGKIVRLNEALSKQKKTISDQKATISDQKATISDQKATISEKEKEIRLLKQQVRELKAGVASSLPRHQATSNNSSLPPSKNPIGTKHQATKSLRECTKKNGGQYGHQGKTLERCQTPNKVVMVYPEICPKCGLPISHGDCRQKSVRQVYDMIISMLPMVTEYRSFEHTCSCGCHVEGEFPAHVKSPICYGPGVRATVAYLNSCHSIPFKRLTDVMETFFGIRMSQGTISNILNDMRKCCSKRHEEIRELVESDKVIGGDESGININGENNWMWVFQTKLATYLSAHKSRGKDVICDTFPNGLPNATMVTDRHQSYFTKDGIEVGEHQVCIAHLLRNLVNQSEINPDLEWPIKMLKLLRDAVHLANTGGNTKEQFDRIQEELESLLKEEVRLKTALRQEDFDRFREGLAKHKDHILVFLRDPDVPPTNNDSERALRPAKTKMKVSGCFRTKTGAENYAVLESVIQTAKKQGKDPYKILKEIALLSEKS